jgi:hypothetical protein
MNIANARGVPESPCIGNYAQLQRSSNEKRSGCMQETFSTKCKRKSIHRFLKVRRARNVYFVKNNNASFENSERAVSDSFGKIAYDDFYLSHQDLT